MKQTSMTVAAAFVVAFASASHAQGTAQQPAKTPVSSQQRIPIRKDTRRVDTLRVTVVRVDTIRITDTTTVSPVRPVSASTSAPASTRRSSWAATHVPSESTRTVPSVSAVNVAARSAPASWVAHSAGRLARWVAMRSAIEGSLAVPVAT